MTLDINRPDLTVGVVGTGAMGRGRRRTRSPCSVATSIAASFVARTLSGLELQSVTPARPAIQRSNSTGTGPVPTYTDVNPSYSLLAKAISLLSAQVP